MWLASLGARCDPAAHTGLGDTLEWMHETDTAFGRLTHLAPVATVGHPEPVEPPSRAAGHARGALAAPAGSAMTNLTCPEGVAIEATVWSPTAAAKLIAPTPTAGVVRRVTRGPRIQSSGRF